MSNEQRFPLARSLPKFGQRAALAEIEQRGYALPCHVTAVNGAIVTVAFDVATTTGAPIPACTMALAGSEYISLPIQIGCPGVAYPASCDISIETGLGSNGALPNLSTLPANLSALVFFPVGNANWTPIPGAGGAVGIDASVVTTDNVSVGNGASGTFTTGTGQTVDVIDGIIVNIY